MKSLLKYSLGIVALVFCSFLWTEGPVIEVDKWDPVLVETSGPISFSLELKTKANLSDNSWIGIKLENETGEELRIVNALYEVTLQSKNSKGKIISEGFFMSENPIDIFDLPFSPNPFDETKLPLGLTEEAQRISSLCTSILGHTSEVQYVDGTFEFYIELEGTNKYVVAPDKIDFVFTWLPMTESQKNGIIQELKTKLSKPSASSFEVHRLARLLEIPGINKFLTAEELVTGLGLRKDLEDGRQAIAEFLSREYSKDPILDSYYEDHVLGQDYRIIEDLRLNANLWSKDYIDPLILWLKDANNSTKYRILELLNKYQNDWKKKESIVKDISGIVTENFGELLKSQPEELNQRELVSWAAAAHMWSLSTDKEAVAFLLPYLKIKKSIIGSELLLDHNSYGTPRPSRVCDVALEAIIRLEGKHLEKTYKNAGFSPPYIYGEANIIIKKVRNDLIKSRIEKQDNEKV